MPSVDRGEETTVTIKAEIHLGKGFVLQAELELVCRAELARVYAEDPEAEFPVEGPARLVITLRAETLRPSLIAGILRKLGSGEFWVVGRSA